MTGTAGNVTVTMQGTLAAPAKLAFGALISAARRSVFGRFRRFAKLAAVPFLLALAFTALELPVRMAVPGGDLVFMLLDLIPFAFLGVALSRVVLLGEEAGFLPPQPLGRRTWVYIGYTLLMIVSITIPIIVVAIGAFGAAFALEGQAAGGGGVGWVIAGGLLALLVLLYFVVRFSLVFPALSVDHKLGLAGSWRLTRGNGLKLFGVILAIFLFTVLAGAIGSMVIGGEFSLNIGGAIEVAPGATAMDTLIEQAPALVWSTLVTLVSLGLTTGAYAYAYAQLSGWGGPRAEILERFE